MHSHQPVIYKYNHNSNFLPDIIQGEGVVTDKWKIYMKFGEMEEKKNGVVNEKEGARLIATIWKKKT